MLLMPIAPSEAVTRATTHLVTFLETPPLVNVPTSGIPMQNTSILLIVAIIPELFPCLFQHPKASPRRTPRCTLAHEALWQLQPDLICRRATRSILLQEWPTDCSTH